MNRLARQKFSSETTADVLESLRDIAEAQGLALEDIVDEALRYYVDRYRTDRPRPHVIAAFAASLDEFDDLYRELAK